MDYIFEINTPKLIVNTHKTLWGNFIVGSVVTAFLCVRFWG